MFLQAAGRTALRSEPTIRGQSKKKFEQVWCSVEGQSAAQVSFLRINELIVICNPSVVRTSVSKHFKKVQA